MFFKHSCFAAKPQNSIAEPQTLSQSLNIFYLLNAIPASAVVSARFRLEGINPSLPNQHLDSLTLTQVFQTRRV